MRADNTPAGLSILAECTTDVRQWYLQNGLQLNPDKTEALIIGTTNQLRAVMSSVSSVSVAGVDLPVADEISAGGRARSASVVPQTRVGDGAIVQLPCTGYPTHSTPADYGTGTDTGLWSHPVQDRLLQCCAPCCSKLQHQEVAASTEQRSSDRYRSIKTIHPTLVRC